jgi:hypothetical protein
MRTYYRGPDAVVTSELFVWLTRPARIFVIRELRDVGITGTAVDRGWWRTGRWSELRASYRGSDVILFAGTDTRVFNQIARALRRALEEARPHATWPGYETGPRGVRGGRG